MLFQKLLFTTCISLATAAPFRGNSEEDHVLEARQLSQSTPGINWDYVTKECEPHQQEILRRVAISTGEYLDPADGSLEGSGAWHQYFLDVNLHNMHGHRGWKWSPRNIALYGNIRNSITQARLWATKGHRSGRQIEIKQISYRCKEDFAPRCSDSPKGLGAYVHNPSQSGKGWQILFCGTFFKQRYAKDIVNAGLTTDINKLVSYEHLLAHEYMHVGLLGHPIPIIDVNTTLLPSSDGAPVQVYGASRCKEWAWLNVPEGDDPRSYYTNADINREVTHNADNYAWYVTEEFYNKKWGKPASSNQKRQDGSKQFDKAGLTVRSESGNEINNGVTYDYGTDKGDADVAVGAGGDLQIAWPQNCHAPDPDGRIVCDYIGDEYTEFKKDTPPVGPAPTSFPNSDDAGEPAPDPAPPGTPPPAPTYAKGWCGMHVVQYQKNVHSDDSAHPPNPEYLLNIHIVDAKKETIGVVTKPKGVQCGGCSVPLSMWLEEVALNGKATLIESELPLKMEITVGAVDADPILFKYGDQSWGSNDQAHHSNFGPFEDGKRHGDTGFTC